MGKLLGRRTLNEDPLLRVPVRVAERTVTAVAVKLGPVLRSAKLGANSDLIQAKRTILVWANRRGTNGNGNQFSRHRVLLLLGQGRLAPIASRGHRRAKDSER